MKTKKEILQQLGYTVNKGNIEKQMLFENIISQAMDEWAKQQINLSLGNVMICNCGTEKHSEKNKRADGWYCGKCNKKY